MGIESIMRWAAVCMLLGATACQTAGNTAPTLASEEPLAPAPEASVAEKPAAALDLDSVYFDYNRWELREDARRALKENARKIQSGPASEMLVVEGHCDERGSEEYNMALGDRRAQVVSRYLQDLGVPGSRLRTVSFGEAQPAAVGHDESAWRYNRRSEIRVDERTASN